MYRVSLIILPLIIPKSTEDRGQRTDDAIDEEGALSIDY
jgi:hypothetical protein